MGTAVGQQCFGSTLEAADWLYSSAAPRIDQDGFAQFVRGPDGWTLNTYKTVGNSAVLSSSVAVSPQLPECSPLTEITDGWLFGWALVLPAFLAFMVLNLRKGLM
jgi:hypothetical protein